MQYEVRVKRRELKPRLEFIAYAWLLALRIYCFRELQSF